MRLDLTILLGKAVLHRPELTKPVVLVDAPADTPYMEVPGAR